MDTAEDSSRVRRGGRSSCSYSCAADGAADASYLDRAVDSSRKEASSGDGQSGYAALVPQQGLSTDHVVHAPHLENTSNVQLALITTDCHLYTHVRQRHVATLS